MAGQIKGITIEIGGNTQPLEKALGDVNKKTRDLQGELKSVERLLKLDPGNTELLAQKQKLLTEQVENSAEKLNRLKAAQEQVNQAFQRGDLGEEQYRHFQRQVINAEQDLKKFENQLKEVSSKTKITGADIKEMGDKVRGIGQSMSVGVTAPIVGGFAAVTEGTRELRMDMGKLEAAFTTAGFTAEQAKDVYFDFYGILGESDTAIEAVNHLAQLTNSQEELADWTTIATGVFATFGDSLPIEGLTEAANETAKVGQVVGPLADALNWAGISEDAFNKKLAACSSEQERAALITETLTGKYGEVAEKYREVNAEVIKANEANARLKDSFAILGATLEPILTPIIEKVTEFVNKFNEMGPAGQKIVLIVAGIAAAIGPLLIVIGSLMTALPGLATAIGVLTGPIGITIAAIVAIGAALVALYKNNEEFRESVNKIWSEIKESIKSAIDQITAWWQEWGPAIMAIVKPIWETIKTYITTVVKVIGEIISLFLNVLTGDWEGALNDLKDIAQTLWDGIKGIFKGLADTLSGIWNLIIQVASNRWNTFKETILSPIRSAKDSLMGIISSIVNAFANMRISIPTPKLPHISVSTKYKSVGSVKVPYPDFDLNWYKTGGIFARPSVIGVGEAGTEVVAPLDKLPGLIARALKEAIGANGADSTGFDRPIQLVVNLDGRVIAQNLYNLQQDKSRGKGMR
ncbi:MAG: hypothetical protein ABFD04_11745 [Syntrophomonas sp.]